MPTTSLKKRVLRFAVSTALLTTPLVVAGSCGGATADTHVNEGPQQPPPQDPPPDEPHVNEGPQEPPTDQPPQDPEPPHVNEGPH